MLQTPAEREAAFRAEQPIGPHQRVQPAGPTRSYLATKPKGYPQAACRRQGLRGPLWLPGDSPNPTLISSMWRVVCEQPATWRIGLMVQQLAAFCRAAC